MPPRLRRITPITHGLRMQYFSAAVAGVLIATQLISELLLRDQATYRLVFMVLFAVSFVMALNTARRGIYANESAIGVVMSWSAKQVRFDQIAGFEWLSNLQNAGRPGKRLWIVLEDGQKVVTPVVIGATFWAAPEVAMSEVDAEKFVADIEARVRQAR